MAEMNQAQREEELARREALLAQREAQLEKTPYMLVVGDRDMENGTVSPRHRAAGDLGAMSLADFQAKLRREVDEKLKDSDL